MQDPVKKQVEAGLKQYEGAIVARRVTVHGETFLRRKNGRDTEEPLSVEDLKAVPKGFNERHKDIMGIVYTAIVQIVEKNRAVPLTRGELVNEFGVKKKELGDMVRYGMLQERIIQLHTTKAGKRVGARCVVYPTPQGRAYIREHFDEAYGIPANA